MTNPIIAFQNVSKVFEDSGTQVLKDINFELEEGKFYTLLGASGSGKSTILNIIAGLLDATSGDVLWMESVLMISLSIKGMFTPFSNLMPSFHT